MSINYTIKLIDKKIAKNIIILNHYSHKWSSCRYAIGLFDKEELIGVAVYGYPVGRQVLNSICSGLQNSDILELTRLWLKDEAPKNSESYFLGKTFDWLRKNTTVKVLISYSDPIQGHVGIIYQATNWIYQGNCTMLVKGYLHHLKGEILHPRTVVAVYGTTKIKELLKIDPNYFRTELLKKHRYIYLLDKKHSNRIRKILKHPEKAYPKNNNNSKWE